MLIYAADNTGTNSSVPKTVGISLGTNFALALKEDGSVWAWGSNGNYQLGNGTRVDEVAPVPVEGLPRIKMISVKGIYAFALDTDNNLWGWGSGVIGEYSTKYTKPSLIIPNVTDAKALIAGHRNLFILKDDGTIFELIHTTNWDGEEPQTTVELKKLELEGVVSVKELNDIVYAITQDGRIWYLGNYQVIDGVRKYLESPFNFLTVPGAKDISLPGIKLSLLKNDGTVWISDSKNFEDIQLKQVDGLNNIESLSLFNYAMKSDGTIWTWEYDENEISQLRKIEGLPEIEKMLSSFNGIGKWHLALDRYGSVWGWGNNYNGKLGIGEYENTGIIVEPRRILLDTAPNPPEVMNTHVNGMVDWVSPRLTKVSFAISSRLTSESLNNAEITVTDEYGNELAHTSVISNYMFPNRVIVEISEPLLLAVEYTVRLQGVKDAYGKTMEEAVSRTFKLNVPEINHTSIDAGRSHSIANITWNIYQWGTLSQTKKPRKAETTIPLPVVTFDKALRGRDLSAGGNHNLAIRDRTIWVWGDNSYGQLGTGKYENWDGDNYWSPVNIDLDDVVNVSAGDRHSLAVRGDGSVWSWGANDRGQLGDDSTVERLAPTHIPGIDKVVYVSAGGNHSLALRSDGTVWAWGDNRKGQLAQVEKEYFTNPVQIGQLSDVLLVSAGYEHNLALKRDGTVWAWGNNDNGQLGNTTFNNSKSPFRLELKDIKYINAGYDTSLAIDEQGNLWSWGKNSSQKHTPGFVMSGVRVAVAGFDHNVAEMGNPSGKIVAWGSNRMGQLGDGKYTDSWEPVAPDLSRNTNYSRLAGSNRIETALEVSRLGWPNGSNAVVLVRADDFPDALTGVPLAYFLNAPILLTNRHTLSPQTRAEIQRLQPDKIYILGLEGAVSKDIEQSLEKDYDVTRIGGSDRYHTSALIANFLADSGFLDSDQAVLAYGGNYPDALSVSPLAAYAHTPILLTRENYLPYQVSKVLQDLDIQKTIIIGGEAVISKDIENRVVNPIRLNGKDRYNTSIAIAQGDVWNNRLYTDTVFFATGKDFPDALAGAVLAARMNSPIILVDGYSSEVGEYLYLRNGYIRQVHMLGGLGILDSKFASLLQDKIKNIHYLTDKYYGVQ